MMSRAQYNVSLLQVLESERRIKQASILNLFEGGIWKDHHSNFFEIFYAIEECDSVSQQNINLQMFADVIEDNIEYNPDAATLQSLTFVAGYTVYSVLKNSKHKCTLCFSSLTLESCVEFDDADPSTYLMIQPTDHGSLKWPSQPVIEATITSWVLYLQIETKPETFAALIKSQTRSVLVQLTVQKIESNDC